MIFRRGKRGDNRLVTNTVCTCYSAISVAIVRPWLSSICIEKKVLEEAGATVSEWDVRSTMVSSLPNYLSNSHLIYSRIAHNAYAWEGPIPDALLELCIIRIHFGWQVTIEVPEKGCIMIIMHDERFYCIYSYTHHNEGVYKDNFHRIMYFSRSTPTASILRR